MTRKLNNADRAAVDLLFDRLQSPSGDGNGGDGVVTVSVAVPDANLKAVETVLSLLAQMPAPEPPADLATRTLSRVAHATGTSPTAIPGTFARPDQPHA